MRCKACKRYFTFPVYIVDKTKVKIPDYLVTLRELETEPRLIVPSYVPACPYCKTLIYS